MEVIKEGKKTQEQINSEYAQWCAKAGDIQYKIQCFTGELNFINTKLKEINDEAIELNGNSASGNAG